MVRLPRADNTISPTRRLYRRFKSRLPGGLPGDYRDPAEYWERRHASRAAPA